MTSNEKLLLRLAFMALIIWLLAKFVAVSPGGITIGAVRKHKSCGGSSTWQAMRDKAGNTFTATGMQTEMIATPGTGTTLVGVPQTLY